MTTNDFDRPSPDVDRLMTAWLDAEARVRVPDTLLAETLTRTSRQRPLPAWRLPERWLPMELTMRRATVPRALPYLAILAVLVLLAAIALVIAGSRHKVPPPFGPAVNGNIAFVTDGGDVAVVDPLNGSVTPIVTSPEVERYPVYSLDGTRIAFIRTTPGGEDLFVVDPVARALTRLTTQPLPASDATGVLAWSPDGARLAFQSSGRLWIARTDGLGVQELDVGLPIDAEIEWRPPDGREIAVRAKGPMGAGLFLVPADGSAPPRPITPADGGIYDYLWVSWSPLGDRVAFHTDRDRRVHVLTIGQKDATVLEPVGGYGLMFPRFSPDGSRLAMMTWLPDGRVRVGVAPADDPTPEVSLTGPIFGGGIQFDWSPDGTEILVVGWGSDQPWVLDPDGGPGQKTPWRIRVPDWVEWQRLAR